MSKYQDKDTYWHDRECFNGEPRSNNRNIYTAYAKYLAPGTVENMRILSEYSKCVKTLSPLKINRLPGKEEPLFSKDEVIGAVSLGLLSNETLSRSYYNFCNQDVEFERKLSLKSVYRAIKALYAIRNEHRNYIWENKVLDGYPLAFRLAPEDIYYVRRMSGKRAGIFNTLVFYANTLLSMYNGNKSAKMLTWLKLADLKHPLLKYIPLKDYVLAYFGPDHTFYHNITSSEGKWKN